MEMEEKYSRLRKTGTREIKRMERGEGSRDKEERKENQEGGARNGEKKGRRGTERHRDRGIEWEGGKTEKRKNPLRKGREGKRKK